MVYTGESDDFDWDDANAGHIARHGVSPDEAEEVFSDERSIFLRARSRPERRWEILGATDGGRILAVVFTRRERLVRVVTARDADNRERHTYRKQRR